MGNDSWRPLLHLAPWRGSISDPNGLCQFKGTYHFFCQNAPTYPGDADSPHGWGHFASRDLVNWVFLGCHVFPDSACDADGSYSGGAFVNDAADELWIYYTGNVRDGVGDGTTSGRLANQTLMKSYNGINLQQKQVVLDNAGYPAWCSCHVRDPKVWAQEGRLHMMLGARTLADSRGSIMLYSSDDGYAWEMTGSLTNPGPPFGYMWECPDRIVLAGREFLSTCPQGMATAEESRDSTRLSCQNVHAAGYFPLDGTVLDLLRRDEGLLEGTAPHAAVDASTFVDWDFGFDFYACQSFVDETGRTILVGWMSLPHDASDERPYDNPTDTWRGALTVPRVLTLAEDGAILQNPAAEMDALRGEGAAFEGGVTLAPGAADVILEGIEGDGAVRLGDGLELRVEDGVATLEFFDESWGRGRHLRRARCGDLRDLRILVDTSILELYLNGGRTVFSTRYFPEPGRLRLAHSFVGARATLYPMRPIAVNYLVER